uniref:Plastocyanin-like domain-containing protein n=1 Tax=Neobacillus citreus TaxID=2833578 RepID=A0A942Y9T5_9BACI
MHFHGIDNSFKGDGTPGVSQKEVEEGSRYTDLFMLTIKESGFKLELVHTLVLPLLINPRDEVFIYESTCF